MVDLESKNANSRSVTTCWLRRRHLLGSFDGFRCGSGVHISAGRWLGGRKRGIQEESEVARRAVGCRGVVEEGFEEICGLVFLERRL